MTFIFHFYLTFNENMYLGLIQLFKGFLDVWKDDLAFWLSARWFQIRRPIGLKYPYDFYPQMLNDKILKPRITKYIENTNINLNR